MVSIALLANTLPEVSLVATAGIILWQFIVEQNVPGLFQMSLIALVPPAILALLAAEPDYHGPSAMLDAADRRWLRERGHVVSPREPAEPLHVLASRARAAKKASESATVERIDTSPTPGT